MITSANGGIENHMKDRILIDDIIVKIDAIRCPKSSGGGIMYK